ncbi:copper transport protein ctr1 [Entomortierella beljakovae]|nr:copper transport protein ctr1 [Entomortierella beljakovae]
MSAQPNPYPYGNYNTNATDSVDMNSMPSLSHSTNSDGMDFDSIPIEAHQGHINAMGRQLDQHHGQHHHYQQQQHLPLQQNYQHQQYQQPQYQPQHPLQPHPQSFSNYPYQTDKDLNYNNYQLNWQAQAIQQQQQQQPIFTPAPLHNNEPETEMPGLTEDYSTSSSSTTQRHFPRNNQIFFNLEQGADADLEIFTRETLNLIPADFTDNTPDIHQFDYNQEFDDVKQYTKGGNGEIRTAFWKARNCKVILKSLFSQKFSPSKIDSLFDKEVQVMNICGNHENIVQFYGIALDNRGERLDRYMIMQWYKHGDLVKLMRKPIGDPEGADSNDRLFLALDIALGLNQLFNCGFHHGDLHPKNVLIDIRPPEPNSAYHAAKYRARLTDFGLRRIRDNTNAFSSQLVGGVWQFMAPERLIKNRPRYDVRCDIFALGVIYWYLMAGRYPFENRNAYIPGTREVDLNNSPAWYTAIYKQAWSEDPNDRQQSLDEIIQVLQQYVRPSHGSHHQNISYSTPSFDGSHHVIYHAGGIPQGMPSLHPTTYHPSTSTTTSSSQGLRPAKSNNPNHPRNRKQAIPNGMPARLDQRT